MAAYPRILRSVSSLLGHQRTAVTAGFARSLAPQLGRQNVRMLSVVKSRPTIPQLQLTAIRSFGDDSSASSSNLLAWHGRWRLREKVVKRLEREGKEISEADVEQMCAEREDIYQRARNEVLEWENKWKNVHGVEMRMERVEAIGRDGLDKAEESTRPASELWELREQPRNELAAMGKEVSREELEEIASEREEIYKISTAELHAWQDKWSDKCGTTVKLDRKRYTDGKFGKRMS